MPELTFEEMRKACFEYYETDSPISLFRRIAQKQSMHVTTTVYPDGGLRVACAGTNKEFSASTLGEAAIRLAYAMIPKGDT